MLKKEKKIIHKMAAGFSWARIWLALLAAVVVLGIVLVGLAAYAQSYRDKVLPGVYIGEISVGGMTRLELKDFLQSMNDKLINDGLRFTVKHNGTKEKFFIYPVIVTDGAAIDLLYMDIEKNVEYLMNYGKHGGAVTRAMKIIQNRLFRPRISLQNISADRRRIISELADRLKEYETEPRDAAVKILSISPLEYKITSSSPGFVFKYDNVAGRLAASWSVLKTPDIIINQEKVLPSVFEKDVELIIPRLSSVFKRGGITIKYKSPEAGAPMEWVISAKKISEWLNVQKISKNEFVFGLNRSNVQEYLENVIAPVVEVEARDAKFKVSKEGKVSEFQASRPGIKLDTTKTYEALNSAISRRTPRDDAADFVFLEVEEIEPLITTGEVNNFGITEILGTGVSDYGGSPRNRVKNIANAVKKLNGILIPPGEEFSAIKFTEPYTEEGGYLPELVIKGDEIKPEIGGGLCQIGTTLFRMAMNSGMPITERRNHSLVVSYYNDPENGLPGTDATIYDPAPDFKFKNDTGNYILIQAEMDELNSQLIFTMWGTNDGRKGYYTHPKVERWIPHDKEKKIIESTKLKPGEEKCQHAYNGAVASFVYTRELPNGEKIDRLFESYYRPLPEICLVGVEEKDEEKDENNGVCDPHEECYGAESG